MPSNRLFSHRPHLPIFALLMRLCASVISQQGSRNKILDVASLIATELLLAEQLFSFESSLLTYETVT